jgi:hypothetical protein
VGGTCKPTRKLQPTRSPDRPPRTTDLTGQLRDNEDMTNEAGEVELSAHDLRVVARYAAESAQEALSIFEASHPGDRRPGVAVEAARTFA